MRLKSLSLWPVVAVGALCLAVSAPVAIRVEVAPVAASAAGTEVAVMIQVSPEDRARVGANAMVRIELDGEVPSGQSPLWAVRIASDGGARITTVWPPGEHHLKVEIASPNGQETGLWVGTVRIPALDDEGAVTETPAVRTPIPEPDHAPAVSAAAAVPAAASAVGAATTPAPPAPAVNEPPATAASRPEPTPAPEQPVVATAAIAGAATAISAPPPQPELQPEPEPEPSAIVEEAKPPEPRPEPRPEPEPTVIHETMAPPIAEPLPVTEPAPVVEPLRSETAPAAAAAEAAPAPLPDEVAATYGAWEDAEPGAAEMTVVVSRGRETVPGLTPAALRLRIGGKDVEIVAIGDAGNSPLYLGMAVDLSPERVSEWPAVGRALALLAERTGGDRGAVFVAADGDQSGWGVDPGGIPDALESPAGGDLATLVMTSLARFEAKRGRSFLILVTDGRFDTSKAVWSDATMAVDRAGVPILVLALWDDKFPQRARKVLQQITAASGGSLFLVQAGDQLGGAIERYGRIIDAGVVLRFQKPPGMKSPSPVSVKADDRSIEVTAPRMIR